jgi:uncharacterized C2H2 Zn-finger protein
LLRKHIKSFHLSTVESSLKHHVLKIHKSNKESFPCEACGKIYKSLKKLNRHTQQSHENPKETKNEKSTQKYICPICAKIFKSKSNLSQHERTHKKLSPNEYFYCVSFNQYLNFH